MECEGNIIFDIEGIKVCKRTFSVVCINSITYDMLSTHWWYPLWYYTYVCDNYRIAFDISEQMWERASKNV